MNLTRRDIVKLGGTAAAAAVVPIGTDSVPLAPRPPVTWAAKTVADMPEPDLPALLLSRAAFGGRPGDVERARRMGAAAWIDEQLDPAAIDDSAAESGLAALNFTTLDMEPPALAAVEQPNTLIDEIVQATLFRMTFSRRAMYEVMVDFWSDHFSMTHRDKFVRYFKAHDDRVVTRKYALGSFKDLLTASAHSPAMLSYLDNDLNRNKSINENYAREIMELHTLGVAVKGVPYTEDDITEVARCFTGWTIAGGGRDAAGRGNFAFDRQRHDTGLKRVLGQVIPGGRGEEDGLQVIDILCDHAATPRFLAAKLVRRFVTDDPLTHTPELVDAVAAAYARTGGDIKAMLRALFNSPAFAGSFNRFEGKLARPMDHAVRMARSLDVKMSDWATVGQDIFGRRGIRFLALAGHVPFGWPTPDGYPDVKGAWDAAVGILARWNLGLRTVGAGENQPRVTFKPAEQMPATVTTAGGAVDFWIDRLLHRPMLAADRATVVDYLTAGGTEFATLTTAMRARLPESIALILDSPYFLWR